MTHPMPPLAPSAWRADHLAGTAAQADAVLPPIARSAATTVWREGVVWDMWPIVDPDGRTIERDGRRFWFFLTAPRRHDPDLRHDEARIRLFSEGEGGWRDHGNAFPDGVSPGSREWSGTAVLDAGGTLTMFFTAAGRRDGSRRFEQRLFQCQAPFAVVGGMPRIGGWSAPVEPVAADGILYARADQAEAVNGLIKGFRDPCYFRDPADGGEHLLFTGSAAGSDTPFDGVIGLASRDGPVWRLRPPPVTAIGLSAELERPHVLARDGLYYLFWSTQQARFAPVGPAGPTGLYAMVADRLAGPWRPVNGTGLVAANPVGAPRQAYCWWVTGDWQVTSFVDLVEEPAGKTFVFGGTLAPRFGLMPDGDRIAVAAV